MKNKSIFFTLILIPVGTVLFSLRNKIIPIVASVPILRRYSVRFVMKIPFVRKKLIGNLFK
ncbi:hypothetical protein GCM10010954_03030 [Halobacillus andaensis]|uniref:Uncharacterized protein n=1 Tax=Halobacillus andaensis TaxID=1176239 RepID=A0A917AYQ0_HALAA|nr:hypothetical protein [Halobacillus andaensis]GGF07923.1 hypothetical protein GCM10010954_03030 [Halobacillus andaensis]